MFLIDSSAWIEYLRPNGSEKIKRRIQDVLQREEALCCGIILVEILRGARNEKDYQQLSESLTALPQIPLDFTVSERAALWGYQLHRQGKSVSTTDLMIASAAYKKGSLLHLDGDFERIASLFDLEQEKLPK